MEIKREEKEEEEKEEGGGGMRRRRRRRRRKGKKYGIAFSHFAPFKVREDSPRSFVPFLLLSLPCSHF